MGRVCRGDTHRASPVPTATDRAAGRHTNRASRRYMDRAAGGHSDRVCRGHSDRASPVPTAFETKGMLIAR